MIKTVLSTCLAFHGFHPLSLLLTIFVVSGFVPSMFMPFALRNPETGAFARGALRKFCAPNLRRKIVGVSFHTSEEGCAKLSRVCLEFESRFRTILCKYPFSNAPFSNLTPNFPRLREAKPGGGLQTGGAPNWGVSKIFRERSWL